MTSLIKGGKKKEGKKKPLSRKKKKRLYSQEKKKRKDFHVWKEERLKKREKKGVKLGLRTKTYWACLGEFIRICF